MTTPYDSDTMLQQLLENMVDYVFFKDRQHKFIMINRANAQCFGLDDPKDVIGKDDFDFFEKQFAQQAYDDEERIMETGDALVDDEETTERDGCRGWGSVTKLPLRDQAGNIIGIMGIGHDITELKHKEEQLREANHRLQQKNDQIAEDLQVAANLQQTFLPRTYPEFLDANNRSRVTFHHHYEADTQIGGDFCYIWKLDETRAGLFICDVMGHGVRAALVTALIKALADELYATTKSPAQFITNMNRHLFPLLHNGDMLIFATACYAVIDTATGILETALAGHPRPIHLQPKSSSAIGLDIAPEAIGPALAIDLDCEYSSHRIQLAPGDSMLMYTDGITEATNANGDELGEDHLLDIIRDHQAMPLRDLMPRIIQQSRGFSASGEFSDDVCLLGFTLVAE